MLAALAFAHAGAAQDTSRSRASSSCPAPAPPSATTGRTASSLAVDEINAAGGILGKKIVLEFVDTALRPRQGARRHPARARRQADRDLRADLLRLGQRHDEAHRRGAGAADHRRRGRQPHGAGLQVSLPHLVRPERVDAEDRQLSARRGEGQDGRRDLRQQRLRQRRPQRHHQGAREPRHQGGGRHLDRSRPGRFRRRRRSSSRAPTPTRSSSISTRRRARASCARPRSRASTSR